MFDFSRCSPFHFENKVTLFGIHFSPSIWEGSSKLVQNSSKSRSFYFWSHQFFQNSDVINSLHKYFELVQASQRILHGMIKPFHLLIKVTRIKINFSLLPIGNAFCPIGHWDFSHFHYLTPHGQKERSINSAKTQFVCNLIAGEKLRAIESMKTKMSRPLFLSSKCIERKTEKNCMFMYNTKVS